MVLLLPLSRYSFMRRNVRRLNREMAEPAGNGPSSGMSTPTAAAAAAVTNATGTGPSPHPIQMVLPVSNQSVRARRCPNNRMADVNLLFVLIDSTYLCPTLLLL